MPAAFLQKLDGFQYTKWSLYGLHLAMHEPAQPTSAAFDPNIRPHAEMELGRGNDGRPDGRAQGRGGGPGALARAVRLRSAQRDRPDPGAARQAHPICLARDAVDPDIGGKDYETFKEEFAEKIIEVFARYAPNMTRKNIIGQYVYTGREYVAEFPQMRGGDIFMGAFNAEQVMYNHFGYRTPIRPLHGGLGGASGRRDLRQLGLYQRRHYAANLG